MHSKSKPFANKTALCFGCKKRVPLADMQICSNCKLAHYCGSSCAHWHWYQKPHQHRDWCAGVAYKLNESPRSALKGGSGTTGTDLFVGGNGEKRSADLMDSNTLTDGANKRARSMNKDLKSSENYDKIFDREVILLLDGIVEGNEPDYRKALLQVLDPLRLFKVHRYLVEHALIASDILIAIRPPSYGNKRGRRAENLRTPVQFPSDEQGQAVREEIETNAKASLQRLETFEDLVTKERIWMLKNSVHVDPEVQNIMVEGSIPNLVVEMIKQLSTDVFLVMFDGWGASLRSGPVTGEMQSERQPRILMSIKQIERFTQPVCAYLNPNADYQPGNYSIEATSPTISFYNSANILKNPLAPNLSKMDEAYNFKALPIQRKVDLYATLRTFKDGVATHRILARAVGHAADWYWNNERLTKNDNSHLRMKDDDSMSGSEIWKLLTGAEERKNSEFKVWQRNFLSNVVGWVFGETFGAESTTGEDDDRRRANQEERDINWLDFSKKVNGVLSKNKMSVKETAISEKFKEFFEGLTGKTKFEIKQTFEKRIPMLYYIISVLFKKQIELRQLAGVHLMVLQHAKQFEPKKFRKILGQLQAKNAVDTPHLSHFNQYWLSFFQPEHLLKVAQLQPRKEHHYAVLQTLIPNPLDINENQDGLLFITLKPLRNTFGKMLWRNVYLSNHWNNIPIEVLYQKIQQEISDTIETPLNLELYGNDSRRELVNTIKSQLKNDIEHNNPQEFYKMVFDDDRRNKLWRELLDYVKNERKGRKVKQIRSYSAARMQYMFSKQWLEAAVYLQDNSNVLNSQTADAVCQFVKAWNKISENIRQNAFDKIKILPYYVRRKYFEKYSDSTRTTMTPPFLIKLQCNTDVN